MFDVVDSCCKLEDIFDVVHNSVETPLKGCPDVLVHEESPISFNNVLPNLLDHSHVFPICS